MKFIGRHKFAIFTVIMLLIIIILGLALFRFLVPNYNLDEYGNRLDNIEKYKIEDSRVNEMKTAISENESVDSINYILEGRIVDIIINVKDETEKDASKAIAEQAVTYFSDEQKSYYDIQVLISSNNNESEKYPIMGYKHKTSDALVWSNN